mmetsp:Transcript_47970/g.94675  ORF Transcript_47970/g.94675 Transcript_47970/m.94675 type:complete len:257 (-) Transcript_47970:392-1162(-)
MRLVRTAEAEVVLAVALHVWIVQRRIHHSPPTILRAPLNDRVVVHKRPHAPLFVLLQMFLVAHVLEHRRGHLLSTLVLRALGLHCRLPVFHLELQVSLPAETAGRVGARKLDDLLEGHSLQTDGTEDVCGRTGRTRLSFMNQPRLLPGLGLVVEPGLLEGGLVPPIGLEENEGIVLGDAREFCDLFHLLLLGLFYLLLVQYCVGLPPHRVHVRGLSVASHVLILILRGPFHFLVFILLVHPPVVLVPLVVLRNVVV